MYHTYLKLNILDVVYMGI